MSQSQQGGGEARDLKQGKFIEASVQGGDNDGRKQKAAKQFAVCPEMLISVGDVAGEGWSGISS